MSSSLRMPTPLGGWIRLSLALAETVRDSHTCFPTVFCRLPGVKDLLFVAGPADRCVLLFSSLQSRICPRSCEGPKKNTPQHQQRGTKKGIASHSLLWG